MYEAYDNLGLPEEAMPEDLTITANNWAEALIKRLDDEPAPIFSARVWAVSDDKFKHTFTVEYNSVYIDRENLETWEYDIIKLFFPKDWCSFVSLEDVKEWLSLDPQDEIDFPKLES